MTAHCAHRFKRSKTELILKRNSELLKFTHKSWEKLGRYTNNREFFEYIMLFNSEKLDKGKTAAWPIPALTPKYISKREKRTHTHTS